MRILILSSLFPYPLKSGGHVRIFNLLKGLSEGNRVTMLSLITEEEVRYIHSLEEYCERIETVQVEYNLDLWSKLRAFIKPSQFNRVAGRLLMLLRGAPLTLARSYFPEFEEKLRELLENESYDLIQVEFSPMAQYIQRNMHRTGETGIMLDGIEVAFGTLERFYLVSRGLKKLFYYLEYKKMMKYERKVWPLFKGIHAMSKVDREKMLAKDPELNVTVIPNGVDTSYFHPRGRLAKSKDILFVGYFIHPQNVDGLSFFCREVFPLIQEQEPEARLIIVGGGSAGEVEGLARGSDIVLKGYVEDIRPIMESCRLTVVPIRAGSGTRLKILEALAQGLPVVTTTVGCEGIDARDGSEVSMADGPEAFADRVVKLLQDDALCQRLREEGRKLVEEKYSWESIVGLLDGICREAVKTN